MKLLMHTNNYLKHREISQIDTLRIKLSYSSTNIASSSAMVSKLILEFNHSFFHYINTKNISSAFLRGEFSQKVVITPQMDISRNTLIKYNQVGWGDIKVAILDSGCNEKESVIAEKDFTGTGNIDRLGHGTKIARIIKHLAPAAQLLVGKIGEFEPKETALWKAIEWAVDQGAHIINISSGFGANKCRGDCQLAQLINNIVIETGCIFTVAAGNNGPQQNTINCPACAANAVSVGAIDAYGNVADYSSRGMIGSCKPNILAPGEVTIDFETDWGTSYSAPIIASILAATLNNFYEPQEAVTMLYRTARPLPGLHRFEQGFGVVNLLHYLEVMSNGRIYRRG